MSKENKEKTVAKKEASKTKRRNYKKELEAAVQQIEELKSQFMRQAADFDNFRKRTEKERLELTERANMRLISQILPVLDDFGRSIETNTEKGDKESLLEGINLIYRNMFTILNKDGLKHMECVGKPFDPEFHDALMQVDVEGYEPDTVIEEHIKGYLYRDQVIRHAKVIVSK